MFPTEPTRPSRKNLFIVGACAALAIYTAAMLAMTHSDIGWLYWIGLAAATTALGLAFAWMGALDEVALRAHIDAWFWGGLSGLALTCLLLVASAPALLAGALDSFVRNGHASASQGFVLGVAAALIPPTLGYALWWAAFWLRRR